MPCMCGDIYCGSCGPAQGNYRCPICGKWSADEGTDEACVCTEEEIRKFDEEEARIQQEMDEAERALEEAEEAERRAESRRQAGLERWARHYDELNGAPENDDDR